jgi:hypothetical protein
MTAVVVGRALRKRQGLTYDGHFCSGGDFGVP